MFAEAEDIGLAPEQVAALCQAYGEQRVRETCARASVERKAGRVRSAAGWAVAALRRGFELSAPAVGNGGRPIADHLERHNRELYESMDPVALQRWVVLFGKTHRSMQFDGMKENLRRGKYSNAFLEWVREQKKKGVEA